ncbi:uncharacterized protein LOC135338994 isoform X2 [Halichondria panicea]
MDDLCTQLLLNKLSENTPQSFESVLQSQEKWKYSCLPVTTKQFFSMLVRGSDSLLGPLHSTLVYCPQVHWGHLLSFTVCLLHGNSPSGIKDALMQMLQHSLSGELVLLFRCSLLMSRQASLEGGHLFPSYSQWFKEVCEKAVKPDSEKAEKAVKAVNFKAVSGKKQVQFLTKWLTDLVPQEPAYALKAHLVLASSSLEVNKRATQDYTDLVKTRLSEIKEPVDRMSCLPPSELKSVVSHMEKALAKFKSSGCVPDFLKGMHTFNKPYYQERFLRYLLSPSNYENKDVQDLIGALKQNKMIPEKMLSRFKILAETKGDVSLMDGVMSDPSYLSELSQSLSLSTHITTAHVEFVDKLLSRVCETISTNSPSWIVALLGMLSRHPTYCQALLVRLEELLSQQVASLTEVQVAGLGTLVGFLWDNSSGLDHTVSVQWGNAETLRELAELLIGRLPVWSCDREVATATLLFTTHCTQCIESLCSENIPTTLQTRMAYMRHRVGYGSTEVCLPKVCFGEWLRWEIQRGDTDYLQPEQRYLYMREMLTHFTGSTDQVSLCVECFTVQCSLPVKAHALTMLMLLSSDVRSSWLPDAIKNAIHNVSNDNDDGSLLHRVVHIVCSLPAPLLLGNHHLLAECLRLLLGLGSKFILPLELVVHLSRPDEIDLCTLSPLYHASTVVHSPRLTSSLPPTLRSQVSWLHNKGPLPVNFNPSLLGVCWFCHYASNHGNIITDVKAAVQAMSQSDLSEFTGVVTDASVRTMSQCYPSCPQYMRSLVKDCVKLSPQCVLLFSSDPPNQHTRIFRREFPCSTNSSLYPLLLFDVLKEVPEAGLVQLVCECPPILELVLSAHKTVMESCDILELLTASTHTAKLLLKNFPELSAQTTSLHPSLKLWMN